MKAVIQFRPSPGFRAELISQAPEWLSLHIIDETDKQGFAEACREMEVLLHVLEPVTREVIAQSPRLKLIQKIGVGVNTIDLVAAREHGVQVANMPGTNTQAVVEWVLLAILTLLRRPGYIHQQMAHGLGWNIDPSLYDQVSEIAGKTVGLVGYGAVATQLAPVLRALGARLIYTSRTPKTGALAEYVTLENLLAQSDILSLHATYNEQTHHLLNEQQFAQIKPGAILINSARGGLVNSHALLRALDTGRVSAAALDVFEQEPLPADHPLLHHSNVLLAPHIAWLTPETLSRSIGVAYENCRRIRQGLPLLNPVG